ncbi:MAG: hypothetical protein KDC85_10850 [Saprospiraceae bacterium]|nr:hypothetical protein [Saprospiraceae bacterium]MCB9322464.1 hypothetical protein [Lewinellaceae bacterium]
MFSKISKFIKGFSGKDTGTTEELKNQVRTLLAQGELPEAIQLLVDAGYPSLILLKTQWDNAHKQFEDRKINAETFNITRNRITYAVLETMDPSEQMTSKNRKKESNQNSVNLPDGFTEDQRRQLIALLAKNQWKQALESGKDFSKEGLMFFTRNRQLERDFNLGLVSNEHHQRTLQQIKQALLSMVLPDGAGEPIKLTDAQKAKLHSLLEQKKWPEALELACGWSSAFLTCSSRYYALERDFHLGLVTPSDYDKTLKEIAKDIQRIGQG